MISTLRDAQKQNAVLIKALIKVSLALAAIVGSGYGGYFLRGESAVSHASGNVEIQNSLSAIQLELRQLRIDFQNGQAHDAAAEQRLTEQFNKLDWQITVLERRIKDLQ